METDPNFQVQQPSPGDFDQFPEGPRARADQAAQADRADRSEWNEGEQRAVLAFAITGDLLEKIPEAVNPELYGSSIGGPRRRIAQCIADYWKEYKSRPTLLLIDARIDRIAAGLSVPERNGLLEEWRGWVFPADPPESPQAVYDLVTRRLGYQRIRTNIRDALEILQQDWTAVTAAREKLYAGEPITARAERPFKPLTMRELLVGPDEPTPWLWRPYLAADMFAILTGYAKVGKDTFAWPLAIAVSRGFPFLGLPTTRTRVLVLAIEESPRTVRRRLRAEQVTGLDTNLFVWPYRLKASRLDEIRRFMIENRIGLIVVSTLARFWACKNENDAAEVEKHAEPLLDLARETGCAVLVIHHDGKSDTAKGSRGSSALPALVDLHLSLKRASDDPTDPKRRLWVEGVREEDTVPPKVITITWDREVREWTVLAGGGARVPNTISDVDKIKKALREAGTPLSSEELQNKTGLSRERVRAMAEGKGIRVVGKGPATRYDLAEAES